MATLITTQEELKKILENTRRPIGYVPTMGALHEGHISLIKASTDECKTTIVSIFVNPLQFGPNEDFNSYPRNLENDLKICKENKVDFVFAPTEQEIYSDKESKNNLINPPSNLTSILCGKLRPNHFQGVATVVHKFFSLIQPDYAYFGEKDLQQLYIIRWLVNEYDMHIFIRACPIVREKNGLACSSRNEKLTIEQKEIASNLYKSLQLAKQNTRTGFFTASKTILESIVFLSQIPDLNVEYFEARDKDNLKKVNDNKTKGFYFLVAAKVNGVRLIDNIEV